jgi:hypothetical protein
VPLLEAAGLICPGVEWRRPGCKRFDFDLREILRRSRQHRHCPPKLRAAAASDRRVPVALRGLEELLATLIRVADDGGSDGRLAQSERAGLSDHPPAILYLLSARTSGGN